MEMGDADIPGTHNRYKLLTDKYKAKLRHRPQDGRVPESKMPDRRSQSLSRGRCRSSDIGAPGSNNQMNNLCEGYTSESDIECREFVSVEHSNKGGTGCRLQLRCRKTKENKADFEVETCREYRGRNKLFDYDSDSFHTDRKHKHCYLQKCSQSNRSEVVCAYSVTDRDVDNGNQCQNSLHVKKYRGEEHTKEGVFDRLIRPSHRLKIKRRRGGDEGDNISSSESEFKVEEKKELVRKFTRMQSRQSESVCQMSSAKYEKSKVGLKRRMYKAQTNEKGDSVNERSKTDLEGMFKCDVCMKTFSSDEVLNNHYLTHFTTVEELNIFLNKGQMDKDSKSEGICTSILKHSEKFSSGVKKKVRVEIDADDVFYGRSTERDYCEIIDMSTDEEILTESDEESKHLGNELKEEPKDINVKIQKTKLTRPKSNCVAESSYEHNSLTSQIKSDKILLKDGSEKLYCSQNFQLAKSCMNRAIKVALCPLQKKKNKLGALVRSSGSELWSVAKNSCEEKCTKSKIMKNEQASGIEVVEEANGRGENVDYSLGKSMQGKKNKLKDSDGVRKHKIDQYKNKLKFLEKLPKGDEKGKIPSCMLSNTQTEPKGKIPSCMLSNTQTEPKGKIHSCMLSNTQTEPKGKIPSCMLSNTQTEPKGKIPSCMLSNTQTEPKGSAGDITDMDISKQISIKVEMDTSNDEQQVNELQNKNKTARLSVVGKKNIKKTKKRTPASDYIKKRSRRGKRKPCSTGMDMRMLKMESCSDTDQNFTTPGTIHLAGLAEQSRGYKMASVDLESKPDFMERDHNSDIDRNQKPKVELIISSEEDSDSTLKGKTNKETNHQEELQEIKSEAEADGQKYKAYYSSLSVIETQNLKKSNKPKGKIPSCMLSNTQTEPKGKIPSSMLSNTQTEPKGSAGDITDMDISKRISIKVEMDTSNDEQLVNELQNKNKTARLNVVGKKNIKKTKKRTPAGDYIKKRSRRGKRKPCSTGMDMRMPKMESCSDTDQNFTTLGTIHLAGLAEQSGGYNTASVDLESKPDFMERDHNSDIDRNQKPKVELIISSEEDSDSTLKGKTNKETNHQEELQEIKSEAEADGQKYKTYYSSLSVIETQNLKKSNKNENSQKHSKVSTRMKKRPLSTEFVSSSEDQDQATNTNLMTECCTDLHGSKMENSRSNVQGVKDRRSEVQYKLEKILSNRDYFARLETEIEKNKCHQSCSNIDSITIEKPSSTLLPERSNGSSQTEQKDFCPGSLCYVKDSCLSDAENRFDENTACYDDIELPFNFYTVLNSAGNVVMNFDEGVSYNNFENFTLKNFSLKDSCEDAISGMDTFKGDNFEQSGVLNVPNPEATKASETCCNVLSYNRDSMPNSNQEYSDLTEASFHSNGSGMQLPIGPDDILACMIFGFPPEEHAVKASKDYQNLEGISEQYDTQKSSTHIEDITNLNTGIYSSQNSNSETSTSNNFAGNVHIPTREKTYVIQDLDSGKQFLCIESKEERDSKTPSEKEECQIGHCTKREMSKDGRLHEDTRKSKCFKRNEEKDCQCYKEMDIQGQHNITEEREIDVEAKNGEPERTESNVTDTDFPASLMSEGKEKGKSKKAVPDRNATMKNKKRKLDHVFETHKRRKSEKRGDVNDNVVEGYDFSKSGGEKCGIEDTGVNSFRNQNKTGKSCTKCLGQKKNQGEKSECVASFNRCKKCKNLFHTVPAVDVDSCNTCKEFVSGKKNRSGTKGNLKDKVKNDKIDHEKKVDMDDTGRVVEIVSGKSDYYNCRGNAKEDLYGNSEPNQEHQGLKLILQKVKSPTLISDYSSSNISNSSEKTQWKVRDSKSDDKLCLDSSIVKDRNGAIVKTRPCGAVDTQRTQSTECVKTMSSNNPKNQEKCSKLFKDREMLINSSLPSFADTFGRKSVLLSGGNEKFSSFPSDSEETISAIDSDCISGSFSNEEDDIDMQRSDEKKSVLVEKSHMSVFDWLGKQKISGGIENAYFLHDSSESPANVPQLFSQASTNSEFMTFTPNTNDLNFFSSTPAVKSAAQKLSGLKISHISASSPSPQKTYGDSRPKQRHIRQLELLDSQSGHEVYQAANDLEDSQKSSMLILSADCSKMDLTGLSGLSGYSDIEHNQSMSLAVTDKGGTCDRSLMGTTDVSESNDTSTKVELHGSLTSDREPDNQGDTLLDDKDLNSFVDLIYNESCNNTVTEDSDMDFSVLNQLGRTKENEEVLVVKEESETAKNDLKENISCNNSDKNSSTSSNREFSKQTAETKCVVGQTKSFSQLGKNGEVKIDYVHSEMRKDTKQDSEVSDCSKRKYDCRNERSDKGAREKEISSEGENKSTGTNSNADPHNGGQSLDGSLSDEEDKAFIDYVLQLDAPDEEATFLQDSPNLNPTSESKNNTETKKEENQTEIKMMENHKVENMELETDSTPLQFPVVMRDSPAVQTPYLQQKLPFSHPLKSNPFKGRWMPSGWCYTYFNGNGCDSQCMLRHDNPTEEVLKRCLPNIIEKCRTGDIDSAMNMLISQPYFLENIGQDDLDCLYGYSINYLNMEYCHRLLQLIASRDLIKQSHIEDIIFLWKHLAYSTDIEALKDTFYIAKQNRILPHQTAVYILLEAFSAYGDMYILWDLITNCTQSEDLIINQQFINSALSVVSCCQDISLLSAAVTWLMGASQKQLVHVNSEVLQMLRRTLQQLNLVELLPLVDQCLRKKQSAIVERQQNFPDVSCLQLSQTSDCRTGVSESPNFGQETISPILSNQVLSGAVAPTNLDCRDFGQLDMQSRASFEKCTQVQSQSAIPTVNQGNFPQFKITQSSCSDEKYDLPVLCRESGKETSTQLCTTTLNSSTVPVSDTVSEQLKNLFNKTQPGNLQPGEVTQDHGSSNELSARNRNLMEVCKAASEGRNWPNLADIFIACSQDGAASPEVFEQVLFALTEDDSCVGKAFEEFIIHIKQKKIQNSFLKLDKYSLSVMASEIFHACHTRGSPDAKDILLVILDTDFLSLNPSVGQRWNICLELVATEFLSGIGMPERAAEILLEIPSEQRFEHDVKTRLLSALQHLTEQLCLQGKHNVAFKIFCMAYKWKHRGLRKMASELIQSCLLAECLDIAVEIYKLYLTDGRPFDILDTLKRSLLNALMVTNLQYSKRLYRDMLQTVSAYTYLQQSLQKPRCVWLQSFHTYNEIKLIIEEYLMDLYKVLCDEKTKNVKLTDQELYLNVAVDVHASPADMIKMPYIGPSEASLSNVKQILSTEFGLASEVAYKGVIMLSVQAPSLEKYLKTLDQQDGRIGLEFD